MARSEKYAIERTADIFFATQEKEEKNKISDKTNECANARE